MVFCTLLCLGFGSVFAPLLLHRLSFLCGSDHVELSISDTTCIPFLHIVVITLYLHLAYAVGSWLPSVPFRAALASFQ